jgi:hypothetical protein
MNCINHPEIAAKITCPHCLKAVCAQCLVRVGERELCVRCFASNPVQATELPKAGVKPAQPICSPGTAFGLGLIPGVGAICNGEYLKAIVHVSIFGFLISLSSHRVGSFEALFGIMTTAFYFYMPLEAYHTAKRSALKASGALIDEPKQDSRQQTLWTGLILTVMGCLLFVNQLVSGFLEKALKLWPVVLIVFGAYRIREYLQKPKPLEVVEE